MQINLLSQQSVTPTDMLSVAKTYLRTRFIYCFPSLSGTARNLIIRMLEPNYNSFDSCGGRVVSVVAELLTRSHGGEGALQRDRWLLQKVSRNVHAYPTYFCTVFIDSICF